MQHKIGLWACLMVILMTGTQCSSQKLKNFNLFSIQDDIALGKQVSAEINKNSKEYPLLPEQGNAEIYRFVRGIKDKIIASGSVQHAKSFAWEVKIIKDDKTLNAFCTPGGYIYVYTGLIKFLDNEDQLAGVMGHEIAHAAQRHSTQQMTKIYGLTFMSQIATGKADPGMVEQIAIGLASLKFSRKHETDADNKSVLYLAKTGYSCDGTAGFFKKMLNQPKQPEFLSTHPSPSNRVANITKNANGLRCVKPKGADANYEKMKRLI